MERALALRKGRHDGIHEARKSSRRLRSLLAFLPAAIDRRTTTLDKSLKQLAGGFSSLRDAHVAARTARLLATTHHAALTSSLLDALEDQSKATLKQALEKDPGWRRRRAKAHRIATAMARLPWQQVDAIEVRKALKQSIRRTKKAKKKALEERSVPAYHRWRRRARQLRYQLEFVRKVRRVMDIKKRRAERYDDRLKDLTLTIDRLGWRQDFGVFLRAVEQLPASPDVVALREGLRRKSSALSKVSPPMPKSRLDRAFVVHGS
ncbi:CHAD domain-containing protein [Dyella psychrodurans]|nr:CHAD domain-containing protein [Dyella psychrodurans]